MNIWPTASPVCAALGFWLVHATAAGATTAAFVATRDGRAVTAIVIAEPAQDHRRPLAEELQRWLREITGASVPIEPAATVRGGIVLGTAADWPQQARREQAAGLGPEGFVVRSERHRLWLLANTEQGLQHAVYAFLESIGCRWFFPDPVWTVVPRQPTLTVSIHRREKPAFGYRRIWYGWGPRTPKLKQDYEDWLKHNRQRGAFQVHCGHSYAAHISPKLFEQHPDWFALVKGQRQPTQLCTTHPQVQQRVIEHVLDTFRKEPQRNMVSVEPNDGGGYCECERCTALGCVSDRVFHLANVVAKAVRREFPGKYVGLLAYAFHSDPPRFRLEPGVYVQVTAGFRYTKLTFDEQVSAFRKLGARPGVYDYFSVFPWDFDRPGAAKAGRVYQLAETIRHYRDLGLTTFDAESSCNWGPNGPGYWVAARMMWNPDLDPKALVEDFCRHAFGRAAGPMRRLYERWAKGERPSPRVLKLALSDLEQARASETEPAARARLDRVGMYLHWLRLGADYDARGRWEGGDAEAAARAKELIVYSRRLMDTGLIHTHPMLFTDWFNTRFAALKTIKDFDLNQTGPWKKARTDIPSAEEVAADLASDLKRFSGLTAVEIAGREFAGPLTPLAARLPEAVKAWGDVERSPLFVESGVHHFIGRKGERLRLSFTPFPGGHTVDCHWTLRRWGETRVTAEGDVKAEKGQPAAIELPLSADGVYVLDPGTGYWKAAQVGFDPRPLSVWAGRADVPGRPRARELRLWLPRLDQPLYFFVPKGTAHFVVGVPGGGRAVSAVALRTADGQTVLEDQRVVAGDQISVCVPAGKDGQVWSLALASLRGVVELYDVPPWLARHPAELLVPVDAIEPRSKPRGR